VVERRQPLDKPTDGGLELAGLDDLGDESELRKLLGIMVGAGEQEEGRGSPTDESWQPCARAPSGSDPVPDVTIAQTGSTHRHDEIGRLNELESAGEGDAVDGGDHRNRSVRQSADEVSAAPDEGDVGLGIVPELGADLHVGSGAEHAARAGQDERTDRRVGLGLVQPCFEAIHHSRPARVRSVGAIDPGP
jgi:hypothetical protein